MAHLTAEQRISIDLLRLDYGDPERVAIEVTDEPNGVALLVWPDPGHRIGDRRIFIRPDGTRLAWETVS